MLPWQDEEPFSLAARTVYSVTHAANPKHSSTVLGIEVSDKRRSSSCYDGCFCKQITTVRSSNFFLQNDLLMFWNLREVIWTRSQRKNSPCLWRQTPRKKNNRTVQQFYLLPGSSQNCIQPEMNTRWFRTRPLPGGEGTIHDLQMNWKHTWWPCDNNPSEWFSSTSQPITVLIQ